MNDSPELPFDMLLAQWELLPKSEWKKTFQDVQGTGHKELVCSRLLEFFLDPKEVHGLGDLTWKALLKSIGKPEDAAEAVNLTVYHCKKTELGNYIDLLLISDTLVIGIENKIHAWLYNDLPDYRNWVESCAKKRQEDHELEKGIPEVKCLVMAPRELRDAHSLKVMDDANFEMLTFSTLAKACRERFGRFIDREPRPDCPEWRFQLLFDDFLTNLENLGHQTMKTTASEFLFTNAAKIESLQEDYRVFQKQLVDELGGILEGEYRDHITRSFIYEARFLCIDLKHDNRLGVNFGWGINGFAPLIHTIDFSPLDDELRERLKAALSSTASLEDSRDGNSLVAKYDGITSFDALVEAARGLMKAIVKVPSNGNEDRA